MQTMASLSTLLPEVLPQTMPCPQSLALDALRLIAQDFCKQTGVWQACFAEDVCACDRVISLCLPPGSVLDSVWSLKINNSKLGAASYELSGSEILLAAPVAQAGFAEIRAALRPMRAADRLPAAILEEYGSIIAIGAVARLKSMSGRDVEWTDQQGASLNYELYVEGCCRARARKFRRRFGCGATYINTEDL